MYSSIIIHVYKKNNIKKPTVLILNKVTHLYFLTHEIFKYLKMIEQIFVNTFLRLRYFRQKLVQDYKYDVIIEVNMEAQKVHSIFEIRKTRFEIQDSRIEI